MKTTVQNIETALYRSPFGVFEIESGSRGIRRVQLRTDIPDADERIPASLQRCVRQMEEYFTGRRQSFDLVLDLSTGTEFSQKVWTHLLEIPYGRTGTYLNIAEKMGDRNAVRAVGAANRSNPLAILVPCHRCIASNGDLQGYFYGVDMKRRLLELENPLSFARQATLF